MSNTTDTNQASEDELRESIDTLLERWRNILTHKGDGSGDEYYQSEVVDDIQEIIRTEKLKLLAEVRERVVGEDFEPSGFDERYSRQEGDNGHITHYETKNDAEAINEHQEYQRTELTKLEAEL